MQETIGTEIPSVKNLVSAEEWQARVNLACAYRIVDFYGWTNVIANHISLRVPGKADNFLINPYGLMYDEVTASSLVKIDLEGNKVIESIFEINQAGFVLHSAIHAARADVVCAIHTHTEAGMAVSAQKCGLLPITMAAIRFYGNLAYHEYEGVILDLAEQENIVKHLGDKYAMILQNHGLLTLGRNLGEAFYLMYNLEKACRSQLAAMASGTDLNIPEKSILEKSSAQSWLANNRFTEMHPTWPALMRKMDRIDPSFRT